MTSTKSFDYHEMDVPGKLGQISDCICGNSLPLLLLWKSKHVIRLLLLLRSTRHQVTLLTKYQPVVKANEVVYYMK